MITVNAMGDNCPIPVVKTKKAIQSWTGSDIIEIFVDNEVAVQNVMKMAESEGGIVTSEKLAEAKYRVEIRMEGKMQEAEDKKEVSSMPVTDNTVVVFSSDRMGGGNDELGKVLIKGFIFALTQLDTLPKAMLFYNGGATLTTEGSDSLEDLKFLNEQGVEIMTCGTCLDYYELKDKLSVGTVTNMYSIVETQAGAGRIINP